MKIDLGYIQHLAENHEGVDVEFKETTDQLDRGMETLCGMLNGNGGIVIFDVKNSGKIVGQEIGLYLRRRGTIPIDLIHTTAGFHNLLLPTRVHNKFCIYEATCSLDNGCNCSLLNIDMG